MQRRSGLSISYDTPLYNINIKIIYDILKAPTFKNLLSKLFLNYVQKYSVTYIV